MARGGKREGAGRKAGARSKHTVEREKSVSRAAAKIEAALGDAFDGDAHAYLMAVYKDQTLSTKERLAAAAAALPYEKPRLAAIEHSGGDKPIKTTLEVLWGGTSG